jgi:putative acetyltransferase
VNYTFRHIKDTDNAQLASMIRGVFIEHQAPQHGTVYSDPSTDHLFELFKKPKSILWVAEFKGKPVGCCGVFPTEGLPEGYAELVKFYLAKEHRGKGIGKELIERSIQSALNLDYKQLYLESLPHFAKAIGMYFKLGFRLISGPLCNSLHATCDVWMLKELKG